MESAEWIRFDHVGSVWCSSFLRVVSLTIISPLFRRVVLFGWFPSVRLIEGGALRPGGPS